MAGIDAASQHQKASRRAKFSVARAAEKSNSQVGVL